jgi:hypothetical protein
MNSGAAANDRSNETESEKLAATERSQSEISKAARITNAERYAQLD